MGSSPTRGDTSGIWSYSVMVITLDSESSDPGSSPGRTFHSYSFFLAFNFFCRIVFVFKKSKVSVKASMV